MWLKARDYRKDLRQSNKEDKKTRMISAKMGALPEKRPKKTEEEETKAATGNDEK